MDVYVIKEMTEGVARIVSVWSTEGVAAEQADVQAKVVIAEPIIVEAFEEWPMDDSDGNWIVGWRTEDDDATYVWVEEHEVLG